MLSFSLSLEELSFLFALYLFVFVFSKLIFLRMFLVGLFEVVLLFLFSFVRMVLLLLSGKTMFVWVVLVDGLGLCRLSILSLHVRLHSSMLCTFVFCFLLSENVLEEGDVVLLMCFVGVVVLFVLTILLLMEVSLLVLFLLCIFSVEVLLVYLMFLLLLGILPDLLFDLSMI